MGAQTIKWTSCMYVEGMWGRHLCFFWKTGHAQKRVRVRGRAMTVRGRLRLQIPLYDPRPRTQLCTCASTTQTEDIAESMQITRPPPRTARGKLKLADSVSSLTKELAAVECRVTIALPAVGEECTCTHMHATAFPYMCKGFCNSLYQDDSHIQR